MRQMRDNFTFWPGDLTKMHKFKFSNGKSFPVVFLCFWKEMWPQEIVKLWENVHFRVQITFLLIPWDPISWTKNKIHRKFSLNFLLPKSAGEVAVAHLFFTYFLKGNTKSKVFFLFYFLYECFFLYEWFLYVWFWQM